jgi:hypothetical protein
MILRQFLQSYPVVKIVSYLRIAADVPPPRPKAVRSRMIIYSQTVAA